MCSPRLSGRYGVIGMIAIVVFTSVSLGFSVRWSVDLVTEHSEGVNSGTLSRPLLGRRIKEYAWVYLDLTATTRSELRPLRVRLL